jgi:hypothetical protein
LSKYPAEAKAGNAFEVAQVSRDQFKAMVDSSCGNLKVGIGKHGASLFQRSGDLPEDTGGAYIVREDSYSWEHTLMDVDQMTLASFGPIGAFVEFANHHRAGKLFFTGDRLEPVHISCERLRLEKLRDSVGIEEVSHSWLIQRAYLSLAVARGTLQQVHQFVRALPTASQTGQAAFRSHRSETPQVFQVFDPDESSDRLTMASDHDSFTNLHFSDTFGEGGFDFSYGKILEHEAPP